MRNTLTIPTQLTRFFKSKPSFRRSLATMASFSYVVSSEISGVLLFWCLYIGCVAKRIVKIAIACQRFFLRYWNQLLNSHHSLMEPLDWFYDVRLYVNYECPFCQRVWIVRNIKGLQDKIKLVAIHLQDKPAWFKEKVYPENKVPALEHNGKVFGESLDLIKYIDSSFEGPSLLPSDPNKLNLAEEMISYLDTFLKNVFGSFRGNQPAEEAGVEFDYLEKSLENFDDGPFFLGQFSQVDAAYVPFIERFQIFLLEVWNYDITSGRTKLAAYIQELNKIGAYKHTKCDPEFLVKLYKSRYMASS